jgi:hypothetical protein
MQNAHMARLDRGVERTLAQRVITDEVASAGNGDDLGVPRFIGQAHDLVGRLRNDLAPPGDEAADWKLAHCRADSGELDTACHHRGIDRVDVQRTSVALRLIGHRRFLLIAGRSTLSERMPLLAKHKPYLSLNSFPEPGIFDCGAAFPKPL